MRSKVALATMLTVALVAPAALPCGAPFGNGINADPRQDIIVAHKNGVETYVFQPRFCGSAQEFGLVLPIPAQLAGQPALAQAAVFSYLSTLSQPTYKTVTACMNRGGMGGGAGTGDSGTWTTVVSSGTVGFMDYSQLETGSVGSLTAWLKANGYPYDSLAESAFGYYVDKGWYFVAFKVNQGTLSGGSTCKDLGPIKLTFPTDTPVVPTRMATARSKDTSGALSYGTGFSWRIFGITAGTEQLGFAAGESYNRATNYSGLLVADDTSHLDGLGAAGDRLDKLTLTFDYGSTEPDVALTKVPGKDYRDVIQQVSYIQCTDGGADAIVIPPEPPWDGAVDAIRPVDVATVDLAGPQQVDVRPATPDAGVDAVVVLPPPESIGKSDAAVVVASDAPVVALADAAAPIKQDAAPTSEPKVKQGGGGCAVGRADGPGDVAPLVLVGMLLALLRRRRKIGSRTVS